MYHQIEYVCRGAKSLNLSTLDPSLQDSFPLIFCALTFFFNLGVSGLAVAGYAVSVIELAPKFAGLIMGFANSISTLTGK